MLCVCVWIHHNSIPLEEKTDQANEHLLRIANPLTWERTSECVHP